GAGRAVKMLGARRPATASPRAGAGPSSRGAAKRLRSQVAELLADLAPASVAPKAVIAPPAGSVYSGRVAAAAFATVRERAQMVTRVVLIGPAHYVHLRGIAVPTVDAFETPLGSV